MRNNKLIAISLTVVLYCSTVKPASSQPQVLALPLVANPASLVFVGIVTVAGVSWYIYQDLHKHKVRSRVAPITNIHKIEPGRLEDNNGEYKEVYAGLVYSEEDCKRKALVQGEISGGQWTHRTEDAEISSPEGGTVPSRPVKKCFIRRVQ